MRTLPWGRPLCEESMPEHFLTTCVKMKRNNDVKEGRKKEERHGFEKPDGRKQAPQNSSSSTCSASMKKIQLLSETPSVLYMSLSYSGLNRLIRHPAEK